MHSYTYDSRHRLSHYSRTLSWNDGHSTSHAYYLYDPLGRRVGEMHVSLKPATVHWWKSCSRKAARMARVWCSRQSWSGCWTGCMTSVRTATVMITSTGWCTTCAHNIARRRRRGGISTMRWVAVSASRCGNASVNIRHMSRWRCRAGRI